MDVETCSTHSRARDTRKTSCAWLHIPSSIHLLLVYDYCCPHAGSMAGGGGVVGDQTRNRFCGHQRGVGGWGDTKKRNGESYTVSKDIPAACMCMCLFRPPGGQQIRMPHTCARVPTIFFVFL